MASETADREFWSSATGVPTRETLEKFDLGDMADNLEARGIYAQNTAAAE